MLCFSCAVGKTCEFRKTFRAGDTCSGYEQIEIINKTPHPVIILDEAGKVTNTFPKGDSLIRLSSQTVIDESMTEGLGIKITKTVFGQAEGLPEQRDGIFYIVSQLIKSALPTRTDLLVPAEVVRDERGNIIGCCSLGI